MVYVTYCTDFAYLVSMGLYNEEQLISRLVRCSTVWNNYDRRHCGTTRHVNIMSTMKNKLDYNHPSNVGHKCDVFEILSRLSRIFEEKWRLQ